MIDVIFQFQSSITENLLSLCQLVRNDPLAVQLPCRILGIILQAHLDLLLLVPSCLSLAELVKLTLLDGIIDDVELLLIKMRKDLFVAHLLSIPEFLLQVHKSARLGRILSVDCLLAVPQILALPLPPLPPLAFTLLPFTPPCVFFILSLLEIH